MDLENKFIKAVEDNNLKEVEELIKQGVDIHTNYEEALRYSASNGHLEIVKFLIDEGANIHILNDSPLRFNAEYGHLEVVKFLIEQGANIHAGDNYALRSSACEGHLEVVKLLIEQGADIHANNDEALRYSAKYGHYEIVKFLIEKGANIHKIEALEKIKNKQIKQFIKEVEFYRNEEGCSQFLEACKQGELDYIKQYKRYSGDLYYKDSLGLLLSVQFNHSELVAYLLQQGLDPNCYENECFESANFNDNQDILTLLTKALS